MLIWGNKGYSDSVGFLLKTCQDCGEFTVFYVIQHRKKFTLYFIPTFSYSSKHFIICHSCGEKFIVPKEMKSDLEENLLSEDELNESLENIKQAAIKLEEEEKKKSLSEIKKCPHCAKEIKADSNYCEFCGGNLPKKNKCPFCAEEINPDSNYCKFCGSNLQST